MKTNLLKKNKRKFNLVELSCGVVILGAIVAVVLFGVSSLISKITQENKLNREEMIVKACEKYLNKNTDMEPKALGEVSYVLIKDLYKENLISDDITNDKGESCINNSYVRVYKYSNDEYKYLTYLYCGDEKPVNMEDVPKPNIDVRIINNHGRSIKDKVINLNDDKFELSINGGINQEGSLLGLESYDFSIIGKNGEEDILLHDSNLIKVFSQNEMLTINAFKDYIKELFYNDIELRINARNVVGGEASLNIKLKIED